MSVLSSKLQKKCPYFERVLTEEGLCSYSIAFLTYPDEVKGKQGQIFCSVTVFC